MERQFAFLPRRDRQRQSELSNERRLHARERMFSIAAANASERGADSARRTLKLIRSRQGQV